MAASASSVDRVEAYKILDRGDLREMTSFFIHSSPQKEPLKQMISSKLSYKTNLPLNYCEIIDCQIIEKMPFMLCVGSTDDGFGFGFFILGALVDVYIPYSGAGFVQRPIGLTHCSSVLTAGSLGSHSHFIRDETREFYEFTVIESAYAPSKTQLTLFHSAFDKFKTSDEFRTQMYSMLLPPQGVNIPIMWKQLKENIVN